MVGIPIALVVAAAVTVPVFGPESADPRAGSDTSVTTALRERAPVDLSRPFADTPAAKWGEDIMVPPAVPLGRYPAEVVGAAMTAVRQLIITARLDRHVLETYDAEPVLALLAPHQADEARKLLQSGNDAETWWITTKIAPGFRLLPVPPRVAGSMTPALDGEGELVIRTNYLIAYAFHTDDPERLDGPLDIVAVDRREADYIWVDDARYDAGSQGIYYGDVRGHAYAVNCALHHKGFLAPDYSNPPAGFAAPDPRDPADYFDPDAPLPIESGC
ncbi:hypothetical protein NLM24_13055 [Nocardia zapadnayensis]|uniref:hypothetical protein n=1 Tax=Nocardia rhamnosiphila TaxID=426716 RepID=UPI002245E39B|nr:hypothetical protein [Nocardia zapadnayensis]MCX0271619.1 hypothetical protein [Nocardia zapadnayensis]